MRWRRALGSIGGLPSACATSSPATSISRSSLTSVASASASEARYVGSTRARTHLRSPLCRPKLTPVNVKVLHKLSFLESLIGKIKSAFDGHEKSRLEPDLDPLVNLQRSLFTPGPLVEIEPNVLATAQQAIVMGHCLEFDYQSEGAEQPKWRRVAVFGLIHGPVSYLVGKLPDYADPVPFRLDRIRNARVSDLAGTLPDDWDLDAWMEQSASIWREEEYEIVLRVSPNYVKRAREWRFHPRQEIEEDQDGLIVRFKSGGLWQIADHVFSWGGGITVLAPTELRQVMIERINAAVANLGVS